MQKAISVKRFNIVFTFIIFIIYPLLSLPLIFYYIYHGKRFAFSLLAIFLGFVALLYAPTGDLYRYNEDYYLYYNLDFKSFLFELKNKFDYLHPILLYVLGKLHLNCDLSRFIYVWAGAELTFSVFYNIIKNTKTDVCSKKYLFILFICYFLFIDYLNFTVRFGLSTALLLYGYYNVVYLNKKRGWVALFFSVLNHWTFIIFLVAIIIVKIFHFKGNIWLALSCILYILFFSNTVLGNLIYNYLTICK